MWRTEPDDRETVLLKSADGAHASHGVDGLLEVIQKRLLLNLDVPH